MNADSDALCVGSLLMYLFGVLFIDNLYVSRELPIYACLSGCG